MSSVYETCSIVVLLIFQYLEWIFFVVVTTYPFVYEITDGIVLDLFNNEKVEMKT